MKLCEAYTYYMVPFWINDGDETETFLESRYSLWRKASISNLEENVLYPYIQSFLQNSVREEDTKQPDKLHDYRIYSLKKYLGKKSLEKSGRPVGFDEAVNAQLGVWEQLVQVPFQVWDKDQGKYIRFCLPKVLQDFASPKLVLSPLARVGLLVFCIALHQEDKVKESEVRIPNHYNLADLINLNYLLHKAGKGQTVDCQVDCSDLDEKIENTVSKVLTEKADGKRQQWKDTLAKILGERATRCRLLSPAGNGTWCITDLVDFLWGGLAGKVTCFNTSRIHLFTFCRLQEDNTEPGQEACEPFQTDLFRLARCQNTKYKLEDSDVMESGMCMRTFQNVYMACTVEGSAMLVLQPRDAPGEPTEFFKNFHAGSFSKRYIWIYLMVLMQRHTLLRMVYELTKVDDDSENVSSIRLKSRKLKKQLVYLSTVKVNTYFTDVSDHTQHNQFYAFCVRNLHVQEHFQEIDDKMNVLTAAIERREQEDEGRRDKRLALILAILAVTSASKDGTDLFNQYKWWWGVLIMLLLTAIVYYIWTSREFHPLGCLRRLFRKKPSKK